MPATSRRLTFPRPARLGDVLWFGGGFLVATALGVLLLLLAAGTLGQRWSIGLFVPATAALWVVAAYVAARRRRWSRRDLGLVRGPRSWWHLLWEVPLAWLAAMALAMAGASALGMDPAEEGGNTEDILVAAELGTAPLLLTALGVVLVLPFLEEVFFRRLLYGWFERGLGWPLAALLSSVGFGLVHVLPLVMVVVGFIGLGAAVLVRVHRSLWPGVILHAANNLLVTAAVLTA